MEQRTFATLEPTDEAQYDLIETLESELTQNIFQPSSEQLSSYWIADDPLYSIDFSTWWSDDNQIGGNWEMSLQRDNNYEPYSSPNFMTFNESNNGFVTIAANAEEPKFIIPEHQHSAAMSEQQVSSSSLQFSDTSPGLTDQMVISPQEESPTESRTSNTSSSGTDWACRHCPRRFTKKFLRTKHEKVHTKPIMCPLAPRCQYRTAGKRDMERHVTVHHAEDSNAIANSAVTVKNFTCPEIGCRYQQVGFNRKDNLRRHVRNMHARLIP